ncbi:prolyl oligopeptidase family serine peptidase [Orbus wheelerorum]|uniref:prolyl oligopeptidase family serine peptidase n=1 Tax=Orbus wheelerorum TaxID=3074111 RepID=UPI00370DC9D0
MIICTFLAIIFVILLGCLVKLSAKDVVDKFRWMETDQTLTTNWLLSESERSEKILDTLPFKSSIQKRVSSLSNLQPIIWGITYVRDNCFYFMQTPEFSYNRVFVKNQAGDETLLIDPPVGYGVDFFSPSSDGKYLAYGISDNESGISSIKIINLQNGEALHDIIPQLRYPSVGWARDNVSFFYTKQTQSKTDTLKLNNEIYFHHLGKSIGDDLLIFGEENILSTNFDTTKTLSFTLSSNWLVVAVSPWVTGYSSDLYLSSYDAVSKSAPRWVKIIDASQNVSQYIVKDNWLYLARYNEFSGYTVSRLKLGTVVGLEEKIFEWKCGELTQFDISNDALYIAYHESGAHKFVHIPFSDIHNIRNITIPIDSEVTALFSSADRKDILFTLQSWIKPPKIFIYDPDSQIIKDSNIINSNVYSFSKYESEQKWVTSKDGVHVPLTIIHQKGIKLNGNSPTWLTTYGAYGDSQFAYFDPYRLIWLERGGIIAIAHVRGGGELGPAWHEGGKGANKENSIIDFIKCAQYLIDNNYTNSSKLVISGRSAGGIVIGMAITERPDLFAAAAIDVGMLNMSRLDKIPIGFANFKEFGSPLNQPKDLLKIDAYLNLQDGVKYPSIILAVGLKDEKVSPWQTAKFAARIKEINIKTEKMTLVIADRDEGHNLNNFFNTLNFFILNTTTNQ